MLKIIRLSLFYFCCSVILAQSLTLEQVLSKMDQAGASLKSMSARITQKKWTDILEQFDKGETGQFIFLKEKNDVYLRKDIALPQPNTLVIRQGNVLFYQPKIKQAQKYNLGKNKDKAEFLLLGFGSDKEALKKAYRIRLLKKEAVQGRETYVLELTPRSEEVSAYFSQIVLWVDSKLWVPVQQKLVEPNKDYLLINFDAIKLNDKISKFRFELKLAKDVKTVGS